MATLDKVNELKQKTMALIHQALDNAHSADHDIQIYQPHPESVVAVGFKIDGTFVSVSMREWNSVAPIVVVKVNYRRKGHRTKKKDGSLNYALIAEEIVASAAQQARSYKMYQERDQHQQASRAFLKAYGLNEYGNHPFSVHVTSDGGLEIKAHVKADEYEVALAIMNAIWKARNPNADPIQKIADPAIA